ASGHDVGVVANDAAFDEHARVEQRRERPERLAVRTRVLRADRLDDLPLVEQVAQTLALDGDEPAGLFERPHQDRRRPLRDGRRPARHVVRRLVLSRLVAEAVYRRDDLLLRGWEALQLAVLRTLEAWMGFLRRTERRQIVEATREQDRRRQHRNLNE